MKKISFIIVGGMIALASCTNNNATDPAKQQAHIDSIVNSFVDGQKATLQKVCDDQIMTAAQDSAKMIIEKEKKGVVHHIIHKVVKKEEPKVVPPNTNMGRKTDPATGVNNGRKTEATQAQGVNLGRKH